MLHFPDSKIQEREGRPTCVFARKGTGWTCASRPTHSLTIEVKNWSTLEGLGNMIGNSENNYLDY